jgi:hypothetical protein
MYTSAQSPFLFSPFLGKKDQGGLAAHISPVGGPTPPSPYCQTAACDPRSLAPNAWHCLVNTYVAPSCLKRDIHPLRSPSVHLSLSLSFSCFSSFFLSCSFLFLFGRSYDDANIRAWVNGTLIDNGSHNPYPLTGGIYDPERTGGYGAEFGVGLNRINASNPSNGHFVWANRYTGLLGGIAVWNTTLSQDDIAAACQMKY